MSIKRSTLFASVLVNAAALLALSTEARADEACDAGGPGAYHCSVTSGSKSCEVDCEEGSYACCKYDGPSCSCIAPQ